MNIDSKVLLDYMMHAATTLKMQIMKMLNTFLKNKSVLIDNNKAVNIYAQEFV